MSGDLLVEIETDETILDYESVETGFLVEIKEFDGQVTVGTVICVLSEKQNNMIYSPFVEPKTEHFSGTFNNLKGWVGEVHRPSSVETVQNSVCQG